MAARHGQMASAQSDKEMRGCSIASRLFRDHFGYSTGCFYSLPKGQWAGHSMLKTTKEFNSHPLLSRVSGLPDVRGKTMELTVTV